MKPLVDENGRVLHPHDWDDIDQQRATARAVINRIAAARALPEPWPDTGISLPGWLADLDDEQLRIWTVEDLGTMREKLASPDQRAGTGLFYTPPRLAAAMSRFSLDVALKQVVEPGDPSSVLQALAIDPACGAGVFLVEAARRIAARYAAEILGGEPAEAMIRLVLPEVMTECVFGLDVDPVAVDLAKSALWLETLGAQPIDFMDRNVIVGNPLSGPDAMPPKLEERWPTPQGAREAFAQQFAAPEQVVPAAEEAADVS